MTLADRVIKRINDDRIARGMLTLSGEKRTLVCAALDAATAENLSAASPTPTASTAREEPKYPSQWFRDEDQPNMLTATGWLREEADVYDDINEASPSDRDGDDQSMATTMRAIADHIDALTAENAALRAEVTARRTIADIWRKSAYTMERDRDVIAAERDTARATLARVREVQSVGGMMLTDDVLSAVDGAR